MEPYWQSIKQIIKESDIVLEILDARLVELSRNTELEKLIKEINRPMIFVINKSDLVSRHALELSVEKLAREGNVVYVSNKKRYTIKVLIAKIKNIFSKYGKGAPISYEELPKERRKYRIAKADIVIGVVGYPNVGKSSVINALAFKKKAKVAKKAGTTHGIHWIRATEQIKLIDTPGVIPLKYIDEAILGLIGARGVEKLKNMDIVAAKIIEMFLEKNLNALERHYNIKLEPSWNSYEIIEYIAKAKGHLKKGGVVDEERTATMIVRDWQQGKLRL